MIGRQGGYITGSTLYNSLLKRTHRFECQLMRKVLNRQINRLAAVYQAKTFAGLVYIPSTFNKNSGSHGR